MRKGVLDAREVEEWPGFERAIRAIDNAAARIRFGETPLDQRGLEDLECRNEMLATKVLA